MLREGLRQRDRRGLPARELATGTWYRGTVVLGIFSSVGVWEILILLAVLMMLFGTSRLPQMGRSLGRGMREFKDSVGETGREIKEGIAEPVAELQGTISLESTDVEEAPSEQAATEVAPVPASPPVQPAAPPAPPAQAPAPAAPPADEPKPGA